MWVLNIRQLMLGMWLAWALYWFISAATAKPTQRRESLSSRVSHLLPLLFGGRVNYSGLKSFDAPSATRARMLKVFPQLADVKIEYAWGGEVDITLNRAPNFGRLAPNVYFLQGFSGHGIALTGIAGKLVAEAIAGTAERFDVFARIPHADFPGGMAMRRPALVLAMLYFRLRDLL